MCICARPPIQMTYLFIQRRGSLSVRLSCLYYVLASPSFCVPLYSMCFVFFVLLQTLCEVNVMWTVYKRDRVRLRKDGRNMCSVMCAVIDMLTSSFQATALKPRLAAPIGSSRVCGCSRQCNFRHSVVSSLCLKMPKFLLFLLSFFLLGSSL